MKYKTIIGLEVHIEQSTKSKMFCSCSANYFGMQPNSNTCPVCLGLPGAMPYTNKVAVENTMLLGQALGLKLTRRSKFDRKHYFYPDLPKAYQISQYDMPLCEGGVLDVGFGPVSIVRIHQEEDTGKSTHETINGKKVSLIDFNRSGVPLIEIVTGPDFDDPDKVVVFLKYIQQTVRYLNISDADMEKGSMRLEANISLSTDGKLPPYKVELKNINSFKFLKNAIQAEIERQGQALDRGEKLVQETRGYDQVKRKTFTQRIKEEASDYRYFPEPDLPEMTFDEAFFESLKTRQVELPWAKEARFMEEYGVSKNYAEILCEDISKADLFEKLVRQTKTEPKKLANILINKKLLDKVKDGADIAPYLTQQEAEISREEIEESVATVISENPDVVEKYKSGKVQVIGFLIGQVQKNFQGKADPSLVKDLILEKI